jgi:hypothetical protein
VVHVKIGLPATIGAEILELHDALQTANTSYLLTVAPTQPDVRARAQFVLSEIASALEWWLDDSVEDDRDQQLASLKSEYATPLSPENTRRALDVRNRVATLLVDRVAQVRGRALRVP